ncbi:MAG TPA: class I SAM-dependent rRNA methyltransferase [Bacteroidota bacterium]|nr:class I SAM-dependent rRNA methyltransferase [Bacteroidota bacterium]
MDKIITLKKNEDHRIRAGHQWVFSNEIASITGEPGAGDVVHVKSHSGKLLGIGFFNPHSLIAVRILSTEEVEINFEFFRKRIENALLLRKKLYPGGHAYRLVHGESDFLPGLVIDLYNEYCSIQTLSFGMDKRQTLICDVLESLLHPRGIVERNESNLRSLEGLELKKGILRGSADPVTLHEYGISYTIDLLEGQKTGFFLDQRENRKAIRRYVSGATVLDCFCNEGGFALNAGYAEAAEVTGIDISEPTVVRAEENAKHNGLGDRVHFTTADAFDFLRSAVEARKRFNTIILDPPSFAKNKKSLTQAKRGYRELHILAFQLLSPGGILATASCSHHLLEETFLEIIDGSALSTNRTLRLLEWRGAAPDHPILPPMPETRYLKFGIFQVS